MAVEVFEEIIRGTRMTIAENGRTLRRVVKVVGLDRIPASTVHERAIIAAAAQPHNLGYGREHAQIPGLICNSIDTEPVQNSKTAVYVYGGYFDISGITIKIDGNVTREVTRFDNAGEVLTVTYKPGAPPTFVPEKKKKPDGVYFQPVEVPVLRPGTTLDYEFYTAEGSTSHPNLKIDPRNVAGRINKRLWNGGKPHTWLCTSYAQEWVNVPGIKSIRRERLSLVYKGFKLPLKNNFVYDDHDVMLFYRNPQTRQIPPEIDPLAGGFPFKAQDGNGWAHRPIHQEFDFKTFFILPEVFK